MSIAKNRKCIRNRKEMKLKYINTFFLLLIATVARANFTLTVSTLGPVSPVVIISSNPATGINCGSSSTACSASFASGSTVTLKVINISTAIFAGWGGEAGCTNNSRSCKVLMNAGRSLNATFNPLLSVSLSGNGGGIVSDASGTINCSITSSCKNGAIQTQAYSKGTHVRLTAVADSSSTFTGWSGNCSGSGACSLVMDSSKVVIATFTSPGPFTITVSTGGTGLGFITSSPGGIDCGGTNTICSAGFAGNAVVTLSATAFSSYTFAGWSNGGCSGTGTCVITSTSAQQSTGGPQSPSASFY